MYEYIVPLLITDEAVSFLIVEPLNGTLAHDAITSKIDIKIVNAAKLIATLLRIAQETGHVKCFLLKNTINTRPKIRRGKGGCL
jgi:hypothetical protein